MTDRKYTTEAKINNYLNTTIEAGSADDYILAAQKYIEEYTGRIFKADTDASVRLYNGNGGNVLLIDDAVEITKVEIGTNSWGDSFREISHKDNASGSDYYITEPANRNEDDGQQARPITKIILRASLFIEGIQNHRITAKWGFSESVPDDISFCATVLAAGMYNANRLAGTGNITSEKIGNYSVSYDVGEGSDNGWNDFERVKGILDNYIKLFI